MLQRIKSVDFPSQILYQSAATIIQEKSYYYYCIIRKTKKSTEFDGQTKVRPRYTTEQLLLLHKSNTRAEFDALFRFLCGNKFQSRGPNREKKAVSFTQLNDLPAGKKNYLKK